MDNTSTEGKILAAAKEIFIKHGLHGARMQEIADVAGINKALLHYYFRSKDQLFAKVFEDAYLNYINTISIWDDETLSFKEKMYKWVDMYIDFLTEYPLVPLFIVTELSANPELFHERIIAAKKARGLSSLLDILRREVARCPKNTVRPELFLMNITSLCAYPFLANALYKTSFNMPEKEWEDLKTNQLKAVVKKFIADSFGFDDSGTISPTTKH